ncbi:MAG: hypothetical protein HY851_03285 [candidate division Zixibacteria bacterium]|nr:hypothetical protein [candidate division Zixibacteria bacterium]
MLFKRWIILIVAPMAMFASAGCGDGNEADPRQVVISLFGAMEKNDKAALAHMLDLIELMKTTEQDYALSGDTARVWTNPQEILDDLTEDGRTKQRWFSYQRIVNNAQVFGETASVEVTFVDKANSKGYRTKFGVHMIDGRWKIYSFKTTQGES